MDIRILPLQKNSCLSCAPAFLEDIAPDFEGVTKIEKDLVGVVAVVSDDTMIGLIDLLGRLPAVRRSAARTHHRRAKREIAHAGAILPDEAQEKVEVCEHTVVERVEPPTVEAGTTEEGRGMRGLDSEAEHPRPEEATHAVAERWEIS